MKFFSLLVVILLLGVAFAIPVPDQEPKSEDQAVSGDREGRNEGEDLQGAASTIWGGFVRPSYYSGWPGYYRPGYYSSWGGYPGYGYGAGWNSYYNLGGWRRYPYW